MQFINAVLAVLGFAALVQAASLSFLNKDRYDYVMCFIPAKGHAGHAGVMVRANSYVKYSKMADDWNGVVFTIFPGEDALKKFYGTPGTVQAEFCFHCQPDPSHIYYDISAIKNPNYNDGVHRIWPMDIQGYNTGCQRFPCADVYLPSDGIQARKSHSTTDINLVIEIGLEGRGSIAGVQDPAPELLISQGFLSTSPC